MRDLDIVMGKSLEERRKLNRDFLNSELETDNNNNAKLIIEEAKTICGRYCDYYGCNCGYVLGATCGHDDYYWLYIDKKLKICYSSCVCNPIPLNEMPSIDYSALDYIINNDPETILDKIRDSFKICDDVMMTPVYINGKEYIIEENM